MNPPKPCWACGSMFSRNVSIGGFAYHVCEACGLHERTDLPREADVAAALKAPRPFSSEQATVQKESKESLRRWQMDQVETLSPPGVLLDVGAAYGFFVELALARGWKAQGLELSEPEWRHASETLRLPVLNKTVEEARFPDGTFDIVTLWEVVELLVDPKKTLSEIIRILKPGGWLWLRTNNARFHVPAARLFENPPLRSLGMLPGIVHFHGITPKSLDAALKNSGFDFAAHTPSPMTTGDPYKLGGVAGGLGVWAGKSLLALISQAIYRTSGDIFSSTFASCAQKPDKRKLIVHVITRLDPGGSAENTILSAEKADPQKFRSLIVSGPSKNAALANTPFITVKVLQRAPHLWNDVRAFCDLKRRFEMWRPAIVHTHTSKAGILGRWAARAAGAPRRVHTPHGHVFYGYFNALVSKFYVFLELATARITHVLIALTEKEKEESLGFGVGVRGQWRVVPSGVALEDSALAQKSELRQHIRHSLKISDGDIVVGMVGRLDPIKGAGFLGEAADQLIKKSAHASRLYFIFVGEGSERKKLEGIRRAWPAPDKMVLLGHRPNPLPFMAAMDVYVQPSLNEGMGKTVVMAQAMGLPVVASRVCGIPEVVVDGKTARLVPPADPGALAAAIEFFIADPARREAAGAAGAAWARSLSDGYSRFSVERMIHLLEKIYAEQNH